MNCDVVFVCLSTLACAKWTSRGLNTTAISCCIHLLSGCFHLSFIIYDSLSLLLETSFRFLHFSSVVFVSLLWNLLGFSQAGTWPCLLYGIFVDTDTSTDNHSNQDSWFRLSAVCVLKMTSTHCTNTKYRVHSPLQASVLPLTSFRQSEIGAKTIVWIFGPLWLGTASDLAIS